MNNKVKILLIGVTVLLIGVIIGAAGSGMLRHERMARTERMSDQRRFLNYMERTIQPDESQREAIQVVLEKRFSRIAEIREESHLQMAVEFDSLRSDMDEILTDEQKERLKKSHEKFRNRHARKMIRRLDERLGLTEQQKSQINEIYQQHSDNFYHGGKAFGRRSGRSHISGGERHRMSAEMKAKHQEITAEIEAVLTPEQREKFAEFKDRYPYWRRKDKRRYHTKWRDGRHESHRDSVKNGNGQ